MNETEELALYQEALRAERTAILRWDLKTDLVYGESSLNGIFPIKLKNKKYSDFLLNSLKLHPNDRKFFISFIPLLEI